MIYFCADDYGLCTEATAHIQRCIDAGALNKVSVFPNFDPVDLHKLSADKSIRISLHLNLVEGKCMADADEINLIADKNGNFTHRFGGLLGLGLFRQKELEAQLYKEIRAQVLYWKKLLPGGAEFCIDSHQHTHMIPSVFRSLLKVLREEKIRVGYMRIPAEPLLPYIQTPSLYLTYSPVNLIKQWLLKALWLCNKRHIKNFEIPTACFCGILFSGKMDEKRVSKVLAKYKKTAEKKGMDTEVLFHPGYTDKGEAELKNIVFGEFYLSENRKTEYDSVMKISEKEVHGNALH